METYEKNQRDVDLGIEIENEFRQFANDLEDTMWEAAHSGLQ